MNVDNNNNNNNNTRLLAYSVLFLGIVLIILLMISFIELEKGNNEIEKASMVLNHTLDVVTDTQLKIQNIIQDNQYDINRYSNRSLQFHMDINNTLNELKDLMISNNKT